MLEQIAANLDFPWSVDRDSLRADLTRRMTDARAFAGNKGDAVLMASEQQTPLWRRKIIFVELLVPDGENTYDLLSQFGEWADGRRASAASFWTPWFDVDEARVADMNWERRGHLFVRRRQT